MSKLEAKKVVRKYAEALRKAHFPFAAIYLFGSYAKGRPHSWSDIDVAVISNKLEKNYERNRWLLWQIRMHVDIRIEPHGFTIGDFANAEDPMAYEIRKTGVKVV